MPQALVGRRSELGELTSAYEEAAAGRGSLVLVAGEPGIGKTRLAEEASAHASRSGGAARWANCWEGDAAPAYWPWIQLIRQHAEDSKDPHRLAGELGTGASEVLRIVPEVGPSAGIDRALEAAEMEPEQARHRLFDAVTSLWRRASRSAPTVLVIDDLHWVDPSSATLLRFLVRELHGMRTLVVGTFRDVEVDADSEAGRLLAELASRGRTVTLGGLGPHEVSELLVLTTGERADDRLAGVVHQRSGGNPLFVRELGRLLAAQGRMGASKAPVPEGVRAVLQRRLARLSRPCNELLTVAAVIGPQFRLDLLVSAAGTTPQGALDLLDEAVRARVVDDPGVGRFAFEHALIRDVLYESMSLARRASLHAAVGDALEGAGDADQAVAEIAHHFLRASTVTGPERAIDYAERAGERALAMLAYEEAAEHFERALQAAGLVEAEGDARRSRLLEGLGNSFLGAGKVTQARAVFQEGVDLARKLGDAEALARAAYGYCYITQFSGIGGGDATVVGLLEEALAALPATDSALRVRILTRLGRELIYADRARFKQLSAEAVEVARRLDDPVSLALALQEGFNNAFELHRTVEPLDIAEEVFRLAREIGDPVRTMWARIGRVMGLAELGDIPAVDREIDAVSRLIEEARLPFFRWFPWVWRTMRAILQGRFVEGEELAARALSEGEAQGQNAIDHYGIQLIGLRREQARLDELIPAVRANVELYPQLPAYRCALALMYVETGQEAAARSEFELLAADGFAAIPDDFNWPICMMLLTETCASLKDGARAAQLHETFRTFEDRYVMVGYAALCCGSAAHYLGKLAATAGRYGEAEAHFENAIARNARIGGIPWVARSQLDYARMLIDRGEAGDPARADELLRAASGPASELVMRPVTEAIDELLKHEGGLVAGPNVFRRDGEFWTLGYGGAVVRMKDAKGLRDIARLLGAPGVEMHVADLVAAPTAAKRPAKSDGLARAAEPGTQVLDERARSEFKGRMAELREELEEAEAMEDVARSERVRMELDALTSALSSAYGLAGRPRKMADPVERARKAVAERVRDSLRRIQKAHPELGRHLESSIKTGTFCVYDPERPVEWAL